MNTYIYIYNDYLTIIVARFNMIFHSSRALKAYPTVRYCRLSKRNHVSVHIYTIFVWSGNDKMSVMNGKRFSVRHSLRWTKMKVMAIEMSEPIKLWCWYLFLDSLFLLASLCSFGRGWQCLRTQNTLCTCIMCITVLILCNLFLPFSWERNFNKQKMFTKPTPRNGAKKRKNLKRKFPKPM